MGPRAQTWPERAEVCRRDGVRIIGARAVFTFRRWHGVGNVVTIVSLKSMREGRIGAYKSTAVDPMVSMVTNHRLAR